MEIDVSSGSDTDARAELLQIADEVEAKALVACKTVDEAIETHIESEGTGGRYPLILSLLAKAKITIAKECLEDQNRSPVAGYEAYRAMQQAQDACNGGLQPGPNGLQPGPDDLQPGPDGLQHEIRKRVHVAVNRVRDVFVVRAQLRTPLGQREKFISLLKDLHGGVIPEATDDRPDELSRFLHAHAKVIGKPIPTAFFTSASHHRGPRPRKPKVAKDHANQPEPEPEGGEESDDGPA